MFSIFESVILVFPKHSSFRGGWSNSRRNHANRKIKNNWRIVKTLVRQKNEDSRGLRRLYIGRNFVSNFRDKLFEDEDLKTTKIEEIGPGSTRTCA